MKSFYLEIKAITKIKEGVTVERCALFFQPGRSEVDENSAFRKVESVVSERGPDPVARLKHSAVGQPDNIHSRNSHPYIHFNSDKCAVETV
jgi:hypothetical protein